MQLSSKVANSNFKLCRGLNGGHKVWRKADGPSIVAYTVSRSKFSGKDKGFSKLTSRRKRNHSALHLSGKPSSRFEFRQENGLLDQLF